GPCRPCRRRVLRRRRLRAPDRLGDARRSLAGRQGLARPRPFEAELGLVAVWSAPACCAASRTAPDRLAAGLGRVCRAHGGGRQPPLGPDAQIPPAAPLPLQKNRGAGREPPPSPARPPPPGPAAPAPPLPPPPPPRPGCPHVRGRPAGRARRAHPRQRPRLRGVVLELRSRRAALVGP